MSASRNRRMRVFAGGFTLVEMIVAIMVLGILSGMVASYLRVPILGYFDAERRARLTDAADGAFRRMARDVHGALPNSIRGPNASCFEFLPVVGGGRYRAVPLSGTDAGFLNFAGTDTGFTVLGQVGLDSLPAGAYELVIYNLGIPGADAYAGDNRTAITGVSANQVTFAAKKFPLPSPGNNFHIIPSNSVIYSCAGGRLWRTTRGIVAGQLAACPAAGTVLAENVTACSFSYLPALAQRNGLLTMTLELGDAASEEFVRLYQEVHVNNVP